MKSKIIIAKNVELFDERLNVFQSESNLIYFVSE
jgi:hypothetical protein